MKLDDQVCSLELAKRLKEFGVKQDSLFHWREAQNWIVEYGSYFPCSSAIAAFTVAELGEMLPSNIMVDSLNYWLSMDIEKVVYYQSARNGEFKEIYAPNEDIDNPSTEANARAKMLIHLIENKLMEVPK